MSENIKHSEMVAVLAKPGRQIKDELTASEANLWHMGTGVAGEAGELLDAIKKIVVYRKAPDVANIIEELGDLEFFMEGVRQHFGLTREQCLDANIAKLGERYKNFIYSDKQAHDRADKVGT